MSETQKIKINGIDIAYVSEGEGSPLIMVHGNGEDKSIFDRLSFALKDRYTVYRLDSRCHGESGKGKLSYSLIADDVYRFIKAKSLTDVTFLGFSDGGIVGLLLAIDHSGLIKKYYISGANAYPKGLVKKVLRLYRTAYFFFRDEKIGLMLKEPNITTEQLNSIKDKCVIITGEKDMIRPEHTEMIARNIPDAELITLKGRTHSDYVVHSDILKDYID